MKITGSVQTILPKTAISNPLQQQRKQAADSLISRISGRVPGAPGTLVPLIQREQSMDFAAPR